MAGLILVKSDTLSCGADTVPGSQLTTSLSQQNSTPPEEQEHWSDKMDSIGGTKEVILGCFPKALHSAGL
ncbi:hypothetical protein NHX12_025299 [Muraenolepis orangiensis]|uniref:Uncharacterized protein n=1 Tax=Muraenolepis orangiensis TaxID=630683 RepID=A0A9Q0EIY6_9TELE|nr:hypothetical protein NHX12_025299 [Muraenolepis orangiensis]